MIRSGFHFSAIAALALSAAPSWAQTPAKPATTAASTKNWTAPRTADGQPDIQGIWTNATITPLERPAELAGKQVFTEKEAADYERLIAGRNNMDNRNVDKQTDVARAYNDAWWDRGTKVVSTRRTSLIVDPPDGHIPPYTSEAQRRIAARADEIAERCKTSACTTGNTGAPVLADGPEDRPLTERCILWPSAGPPMLPTAYNNNYQIVQSPGYVAIMVEMIHDVRIVPLDSRPHLPGSVRQLMGDSRGHWEGDTLVVETTNFTNKTGFRNSTENLKLVERFTRTAPDTLLYRVTVEDPQTFTKPWTIEVPMTASPGPLFEYACHETNYGMEGILSGARTVEAKRSASK